MLSGVEQARSNHGGGPQKQAERAHRLLAQRGRIGLRVPPEAARGTAETPRACVAANRVTRQTAGTSLSTHGVVMDFFILASLPQKRTSRTRAARPPRQRLSSTMRCSELLRLSRWLLPLPPCHPRCTQRATA